MQVRSLIALMDEETYEEWDKELDDPCIPHVHI
jgi:hypothetical protein